LRKTALGAGITYMHGSRCHALFGIMKCMRQQ